LRKSKEAFYLKSESRKETRFKVLNRHVERLAEKITDLQKIDQRYFWVRLGVLLISAVGLFAAYQSRQSRIFLAAIVLFLVIFSFVVYLNRRVKRSIIRFNFSKSYFSNQIARMQLDWEDIPVGENYPVSAEHPFVSDLNLTGRNSIHQLLNTSISKGGSYRLQDWLLNENPDEEEMMNRQAGVREISTLSGFRSRLALSSNLVTAGEDGPWDGEQLIDWLQKKIPSRSLLPMLILMSFLAAANIAFFVLYTSGILPAVWIISLTIYAGLYLIAYRSMGEVFGQAHHLSMTLDRFRAVLVFLERYTYRPGSYLHSLCEPFKGADLQPSSHLRRIAVIASASSIGTNPVIWLLINVFVPWDVFFAFQLERYKAKMQQILPT
jgi:hypothetical protein